MKFFQKKSIGLDIADHTIEVAELEKSGPRVSPISFGRVKLAPGIVERGRIKDEERLMQAIREVFLKAKPNVIVAEKVIFGLPESQVYTHTFSIPNQDGKLQEKEINTAVLQEAQRSIPIGNDDLLYAYRILKDGRATSGDKKKGVEILLVASSKEVVSEWQKFFQKLKIEVEHFDIEMLAIRRALLREFVSKNSSVMIVDMGAVTSNIAVFDKNELLHYSYSTPVAGDAMTNEVASALKMKQEEAEKLKIKAGVADPSERVSAILIKVLESILKEAKIALKYFKKNTREEVKEIILVGGSSQLKGLTDYFKTNLGLAVRIGQSAIKWDADAENLQASESALDLRSRAMTSQSLYIEAIGLALRSLDRKWDQRDPSLHLEALKKGKVKEGERGDQEKLVQDISHKKGLYKEPPLVSVGEVDRAKKLRFQKILLVGILIFGILGIGFAFWYRSSEKAKKAEQLESEIAQYSQTQSFDLKVPVAAEASEYTNDRVRGRTATKAVASAGDYNEAVANARVLAEKELKEGERLWLTPISGEQNVFPMEIKWLIYSDEDVNRLLLVEVEKLNVNEVEYVLSNIEKTNIESTDNVTIFYITGRVTLALNELIQLPSSAPPSPKATEGRSKATEGEQEEGKNVIVKKETIQVVIQYTPTGWLNVREGPGTNYSKIGQVYPEEIYSQLEESGNWYKIELSDGQQGWIYSQYAIKK